MADQQTISDCMWLIVYNFMASSNYDKQLNWINNAEESWYYAFEDLWKDGVLIQKRILNEHFREGIKEFMVTYEGTYFPTLAQVSTYMKKNYTHRDREREERNFKDCEDCDDGFRNGAMHVRKHSPIHGDYVDAEKFQLACECEAGRERIKRGTKHHQTFTDWASESPKVIKWWLTDSANPVLPSEAIISEWRLNLSRKKAARGGENFYMKHVLAMDANAKRRDELRISRGEEPVDRKEFVEENRPVGWFQGILIQ